MGGVFLAVTVPEAVRHARLGRTTEAMTVLETICNAQRSYYEQTRERPRTGFSLTPQPPQFVNAAALTPGSRAPSEEPYPADPSVWQTAEWIALGVALTEPHRFQYASPGTVDAFSAVAVGNLDGDNVFSTFRRQGVLSPRGPEAGPLELERPYE